MLIRRFFAFVISAFLIFFPAYSYATTSVGGWTATDSLVAGANTTINAAKTAGGKALKSSITVAASASKVGKYLIKGGGSAALAFAMVELADGAIDWVLDPANNSVRYTVAGTVDPGVATPADKYLWKAPPAKDYIYATPQAAARVVCQYHNQTYGEPYKVSDFQYYVPCKRKDGSTDTWDVQATPNTAYDPNYNPNAPVEKHIPIETVAAKVISNAASGHAPSREAVKATALEGFAAGEHDAALDAAATETGTENPPDTENPPKDPAAPFDPSSIIAAIKSVMTAVVNMAGMLGAKIDALMVQMGLQNAETQRVINDGMADVVAANNATGARVGDVVAAIEALEGNTLDGQVINDAIDRAIAAGHTDTASIVAAIEAIEGNTLDGQVINDAVDRVIANDNVNAQSASDAATAAAEAAKAADAANTAAVTDAIDAQTDAISETDPVTGVKSLKLPAFCSWALPVCDFFDWVAEPVPDNEDNGEVGFATTTDVGLDDVDRFEKRITFSGQCPSNEFSFSMMGVTYAKPIPYHYLCGFLEQIAPWLLAMCYLGTAYFVVENI